MRSVSWSADSTLRARGRSSREISSVSTAVRCEDDASAGSVPNPDSIRPKLRQKIEAGLKETGFRPNLFAVNLNRRRTKILGLIFPSSLDPFYTGLRRRIESQATALGYLPFVFSSDGKAESVAAKFGGFLGFGSNTVLLKLDEVEFMRNDAGTVVLRTAITPESLEGRPVYEG